MNTCVSVFRGQFLNGTTDRITSPAIAAQGNKVVLSVTTTNITGGSMNVYLDGSYDGVSWSLDIGTALAPSAFGVGTTSKSALDFAFVRVRVQMNTATAALFDATLAFSEQ